MILPASPPDEGPAAAYRARREAFAAERDALGRRWNRVANARLAAFAAGAGALGWGIWSGRAWLVVLAVPLLAAFVALAVYHNRLGRRRQRAAVLAELNAEALARLARDWAALPLPAGGAPLPVPPDHPYARDLDLFGPASLWHLLATTTTPYGHRTLAEWLLAPAAPAVAAGRQGAVRRLAPLLAERQELARRGRALPDPAPDPAPFLAWAEGEAGLGRRRWLAALAWLGPLLLWASAAAALSGLWPNGLWLPLFLFNAAVALTAGAGAAERIARVAGQQGSLLPYAGMLAEVAAWPAGDPGLDRLRAELGPAERSAAGQVRRLDRLVAWTVPRGSPLHLPLQGLFGRDLHLLAALERWQGANGARVRGWLAALGEAEALAALANLAHDNPGWAVPRHSPAAGRLAATALGHPLLPEISRVANDVTVGPPGTVLLVTGSNMAGKSTLLRAIGVNAVLAAAGGPVCAAALSLPPVELWTSARIEDSLARGVSHFMAELLRLRDIVRAAERAHTGDGPRVLYLLDEILHGTNTAERQIAARRIVRRLLDLGAIGAVSTHDLALAAAPELAEAIRPIHFREAISDGPTGPRMTFDYRARPGVATTSNALRLLELVELGDELRVES